MGKDLQIFICHERNHRRSSGDKRDYFMIISLEKKENCRGDVQAEVPEADVSKHRHKVVRECKMQASIPGYRPGKIPNAVVEKRFAKEISDYLSGMLVDEVVQELEKEKNCEVLRVTEEKAVDANLDGTYTIKLEVLLKPEFTLPDYEGIPVNLPDIQIDEAAVDEAVENYRQSCATRVDLPEDATTEMGHLVMIDFTSYKDETPLAELLPEDVESSVAEGKEQWIKLDEETFLAGFCGNLLDLKAGDTAEFDLDMPEDLFPEESEIANLNGEPLHFSVTIRKVAELQVPELTDAFLKERLGEEVDMDALREELRGRLERDLEIELDKLKKNRVLEWLHNQMEFEPPPEMVVQATQNRVDTLVNHNLERGISEDEILEHQAEIIENAGEQAKQSVKTDFILSEIAIEEELSATQEDLINAITAHANQAEIKPDKLVKQLQKQDRIRDLASSIALTKALEFVVSKANITLVPPDTGEEEDSPFHATPES